VSFDESVVLWSGRGLVLFTALAAVSGVLLWVFGNRASAAREAAFERFRTDAETRIAEAAARSAESNRKSAEASNATARALASAAAVSLLAGKLDVEAAQLRRRAASAEHHLLESKTRNEPHLLSLDQRGILLSAIEPYPATELHVWKLEGDEASMPADDLIATFKEARWSLSFSLTGNTSVPQYGLVLLLKTATPSPPMAAVISGFHQAGIPLTVAHGGGPKTGVDSLLIGLQPVSK
jgi:hypothetical protein